MTPQDGQKTPKPRNHKSGPNEKGEGPPTRLAPVSWEVGAVRVNWGSVLKNTPTERHHQPGQRPEERQGLRPPTAASTAGKRTSGSGGSPRRVSLNKPHITTHPGCILNRQVVPRENPRYTQTLNCPVQPQKGNEGVTASPVQSDHAARSCDLPTQKSCTGQRGTRRWAREKFRYSPIADSPSHGNQEYENVTCIIRSRHKVLRPPDAKIIYKATWDAMTGPRRVPL